MNYLISEIWICLLLAGLIGALLGWFIRGGCKKKLEVSSLSWQKKLHENELISKRNTTKLEEQFNQRLHNKAQEYTYKVNQILANAQEGSDNLKVEIKHLKKKLKLLESQKNEPVKLLEPSTKIELKSKTVSENINLKRVEQQNLFLKEEMERSVSELIFYEQKNRIKEKEIELLNQKNSHLKKQLILNDKSLKLKIEERALDCIDKISIFEESLLNDDDSSSIAL